MSQRPATRGNSRGRVPVAAEGAESTQAQPGEVKEFEEVDIHVDDPERDAHLQALVALGVSRQHAEAYGYMFPSTMGSSDLSQLQANLLAQAKIVKPNKDKLRTCVGSLLDTNRFTFESFEALSKFHDEHFPNGNFAALVSLSPEGWLQLRGVAMPTARQSTQYQVRVKPVAGGGGGGGGLGAGHGSAAAAPRSVYDPLAKIPAHLLSDNLTARPKQDLPEAVCAAIGKLASHNVNRLVMQSVTLSGTVHFNLEMLHVEQHFLLEVIKLIVELASELHIDWAPKLDTAIRQRGMHEYDDLRLAPTVLSQYALSVKSFYLSDGALAFESFKDCYKASIICKEDNLKISELYGFEYDLTQSATANLARLEKLREALRRSVLPSLHPLIEDKYLVGIFLGNLFQHGLFSSSLEEIAVTSLRELYTAHPEIAGDWLRLGVEVNKLQHGACFRGQAGLASDASAFAAHVQPAHKSKILDKKKVPPAAAVATPGDGVAPVVVAPKAPPASRPPAAAPRVLAPKPAAPVASGLPKARPPSQGSQSPVTLTQYREYLTKVLNFLLIADVKLDKYLQAVVVNGTHTHRWRMDDKHPEKTKFLPQPLLDQAKTLQANGACPGLLQALIMVKQARLPSSEHFLRDLHSHARVMMSLLDEAPEVDYLSLLEAEQPQHGRSHEVDALAAGVQSLDVGEDEDDNVSAVTASTLNFEDVFSGGAKASPAPKSSGSGGVGGGGDGGGGGGGGGGDGGVPPRRLKKKKKQDRHGGVSDEISSKGAQGAAAAASESS